LLALGGVLLASIGISARKSGVGLAGVDDSSLRVGRTRDHRRQAAGNPAAFYG